jgi:threonine dehydratase
MAQLVQIEQIEAARQVLAGVVATTPVQPSQAVSAATGVPALLNC